MKVITQAGTKDKIDARDDARLMQAARAVGKSLAL